MTSRDLDGLYLAVFREGCQLSVCVDYAYITDEKMRGGSTEETHKTTPEKGLITRTDVYLINDNFTKFAGTGEERECIVKSMDNVLRGICISQREKAGVENAWFGRYDKKALCAGTTYMFGRLSSTGFPEEYIYTQPDNGMDVENIDFENNCIKAVGVRYNLKGILLKTVDEVLEMMKRSGVKIWTNLSSNQHHTYEVCNDIAQRYIRPLPEEQGGQPQQEAPKIPKELNTAEAKELMQKATDAGFITVEAGRYKWNGKKVLLAYFAVKATAYLGLRKNANAVASWKPFESLFQVKELRQSKASYEKYYTEFTPPDSEMINALFEQ